MAEEEKFEKTLTQGLEELDKVLAQIKTHNQTALAGRVAFKGRLAIGPLPGLGLDKPVRVFYRGDWLAKQDAQYGPLFNKVIKDGIFQVVP